MRRTFLRGLIVTLALAGCAAAPAPAATPAAPTPSPVPTFDQGRRPFGPPQTDNPAFGAIDQAWTVEGEQIALYGIFERPFSRKAPGSATSRYVFVGGRVYGIHWDDAAKFAALKPGETANLHPADEVACVGERCWRLYHVYPGPRRINPL